MIVQPIPLSGSLTRVILFNPADVCDSVLIQLEREREIYTMEGIYSRENVMEKEEERCDVKSYRTLFM